MALACSVKVACIVTSGSQCLDALIQLKMLVLMWVWHVITKLEFVPTFLMAMQLPMGDKNKSFRKFMTVKKYQNAVM